MAEFELFTGVPHDLEFKTMSGAVTLERDFEHEVPRARLQTEIERARIPLEIGGEHAADVPVYEIGLGGLEKKQLLASWLGELCANQLVVVSRIAERAAAMDGLRDGLAHPSAMIRDGQTGRIKAARYVAIPERVAQRGAAASQVAAKRNLGEARRVINCTPEDMRLKTGGRNIMFERDPAIATQIDIAYHYEVVGRGQKNIPVAKSRPNNPVGIPRGVPEDVLLLVHSEVPIEALRLGVSPDIVANMVFPYKMERRLGGQQCNTSTALGYYSTAMLDTIYRTCRI